MSRTFAQKTNHVFYQTVFTVVIAFAAIVFVSLKAYQLAGLYLLVLIHKIKDACGCESMTQFFAMHPDIFRAVILFAAGIGIFILYSFYKLVRLNLSTKKYIAHCLSFARIGHSAKLKGAIKSIDLDRTKIVEIDIPELAVFCFGLWRPKICISGSLISILDKNELKAVLAHETQHMTSYEPLKLFIVKYFSNIFFFLPGLKTAVKKYITLSELSADEKASGTVKTRSKLAGAILKIFEQEEKLSLKHGAYLSFFSSGIEERANRLSDEAYIPKFKFFDKSLIVGSLGLAAVSLLFIFVFSSSTKAFEMHNIASCVTPASTGQKNDLACSSEISEDIFKAKNGVLFNMDSGAFRQNSACKAD